MNAIPFIVLVPPRTFPRGQHSRRPWQASCGSVCHAQSCGEYGSSGQRPGSWMAGLSSRLPASSNATVAPASTRRRATTEPPEPEPTTT
jgi:hypothetical protein